MWHPNLHEKETSLMAPLKKQSEEAMNEAPNNILLPPWRAPIGYWISWPLLGEYQRVYHITQIPALCLLYGTQYIFDDNSRKTTKSVKSFKRLLRASKSPDLLGCLEAGLRINSGIGSYKCGIQPKHCRNQNTPLKLCRTLLFWSVWIRINVVRRRS